MQVAILAGGLGTRLGQLTKSTPKSLVRVSGKTFLEFQLENLKNAGIEDIILCTGHMGEQIEDYIKKQGDKFGLNITHSHEGKPLGTAGALKNSESQLNDIFFSMYGDSYVFLDFQQIMDHFLTRDKLALMTVYRNNDRYDRSNTAIQDGLVKKYSKNENNDDMVYIDYGLNVFRKEILDMIPENQFYSLEELFLRLINLKQLLAYEVPDRFYEIGSMQGLKDFESYILGSGR